MSLKEGLEKLYIWSSPAFACHMGNIRFLFKLGEDFWVSNQIQNTTLVRIFMRLKLEKEREKEER